MRSLLVALLVILAPLLTFAERPISEQQGQEELGDIPPVLYSSAWSSGPTFVTADAAINPNGELNTELLDDLAVTVLSNLLREFNRGALGTDCVPYEEVWVERVYPPDRSSLDLAVRTAKLVVEATVVARDYGFLRGSIPGQLLEVKVDQVIRGEALEKHFIFVPVGRFKAGPYTFCKTDSRIPAPPAIGDQVLLLIPEAGKTPEPFLNLRDESSLIVFDQEGTAHVPPAFSKTEAGSITRGEVLAEVESLVRERGGQHPFHHNSTNPNNPPSNTNFST